jgi:hypothetical protein
MPRLEKIAQDRHASPHQTLPYKSFMYGKAGVGGRGEEHGLLTPSTAKV